MAQSKLRKAIGAVKDQTSIGLAKVGGSNSVSTLEVAIVKATRHQETPPDDRHVTQIIKLTTHSRALVTACIAAIGKRLNKTKNWVVALKTLMLVQRLMDEGDGAHEREIFSSVRRGTRFLDMADFRDAASGAHGWDYSAFVRTYAMYLDEQLEFRMGTRRKRGGIWEEEEDEGEEEREGGGACTPDALSLHDMKIEGIFSMVHDLRQLLERFLACKPTGPAKHDGIVAAALCPIVKESYELCHSMSEIIAVLIDRFMQLEVPDMVRVYEIFTLVSKQYEELDSYYEWCKTAGIVHEYPGIDKISQKKLDMMDDFIHQKSALARNRSVVRSPDPKPKPVEEEDTKALLPPQAEESVKTENKEEVKETIEEKKNIQEIPDLLNFGDEDNSPSTQEQENKLALVLLDNSPTQATTAQWEAFTGDWETALFQPNSHLSNQKTCIDKITLDRIYHQGLLPQAGPVGNYGRPTMLALPPPPNGGAYNWSPNSTDPFTGSYAVGPPQYVHVSEMERRLLMQEQMFWQQCGRNGMPGQIGFGNMPQQNPYHYITGGYTQTW